MSIKPDWWIRERAREGMIEPFVERLQRDGVISYGLSSFGYDLRAAPEWRIFVNAFNTVVDPKSFDTSSLVEWSGETCIIPPNSFVLTRSVEYLRIPDDTMVVALGKSSYARCFTGTTRVALVDGSNPTLEEMAATSAGGELHFGYSIGPNGQMLVTHLDAPRFIGRDTVLEVVLDDGTVIEATPDHEFMLRDGSWRTAEALRPGAALMPLYRAHYRGYEMTYLPLVGTFTPTHRLADAWNVRHGIQPDTPGTHRHHVDGVRTNNNPWNLVRMEATEHLRYHNSLSYGPDFDRDAHAESIRAALARRRSDTAWSAWASAPQERRDRQADFARQLRLRPDLDEGTVRRALDATGSLRGAARFLGCDRSVFRRFPHVIDAFRGRPHYRNHKVAAVRQLRGEHDVYCLTVPEAGNFALSAGVFVANCGIVANVTPLEPGWEGHVTLELSNTTPLPAKVYANEGIVQLLFFQGERPEVTYRDRKGKYQGQTGVTLPRL
jgi:deoxycytidine triphosphate deaminase